MEKASSTTTLNQDRTHNAVNEVSTIGASTGSNWIDVVHDAAGNMTEAPKPGAETTKHKYVWDAWNRLVKVTDSSDANIAIFEYDGINRRIVRKEYSGGVLSRTRHFYHSEMDQVLEERVDAATAADRQYVWGQRYVDELIVRDRNADASGATGNYGVSGSGLEKRLYATNDALYSVTALTNASGTVQERFQYDPYGQPKVLDATASAH